MSAVKIKICGLSRLQDIAYVNEALPDFIGFVFADSRRKISPDAASLLKSSLDSRVKSVGVFVNEDIKTVARLCNAGVIDLIQLHGDESNHYIALLRESTDKPIIKAFRVRDRESLELVKQYDSDYLLLDTYSPGSYGGTGKAFDWSLIRHIGKPFFLAGGIDPDNAKAAIEAVHPYCLDASSSLETEGFKDRGIIMNFIKTVRSVE